MLLALTTTAMLLQGLPFAALFSLAAFSYQRSLHPLYGSVPTQLYLTPVVAASLLLGTLAPAPAFSTTAYNAAIWLFITPRIARHAALWSTKLDDPVKGPVVVHALVLAPLMVMSASLVKRLSVSTPPWIVARKPLKLETIICVTSTETLLTNVSCRRTARQHTLQEPHTSSPYCQALSSGRVTNLSWPWMTKALYVLSAARAMSV